MNKSEAPRSRYHVQWNKHGKHMCNALCSLMEHGSLVDLAICCGTNTIHAHKCVLAANSPFFRDQFEKNPGTEQIVIVGLDFVIIKSIIEYMYCGETVISEENVKYVIATAKQFQMHGLQLMVSENAEAQKEADSIQIQTPLFLPRKPKYISAFRSLANPVPTTSFNNFKNPQPNNGYHLKKAKRKFVGSEAEKACAKEAAASRLALEALQKELATTSQTSSFVIEETCTETTVENFIPHSEEPYINQIETVPMQVVNYEDEIPKKFHSSNKKCGPLTRDLKRLLPHDIPGNVEIMFRTSEGNFVNSNDDGFLSLLGSGTLQYQILDENGQVREVRELELHPQMYDPLQVPLDQSLEINKESLAANKNSVDSDVMHERHFKVDIETAADEIEVEKVCEDTKTTINDPLTLETSTFAQHTSINDSNSFVHALNSASEHSQLIPNDFVSKNTDPLKLEASDDFNWYESKENDSKAMNTVSKNLSAVFQNYLQQSCEANANPAKKVKLSSNNLVASQFTIPSIDSEVPFQMFEDSKSPKGALLKKMRSQSKAMEDEIKCDKPRKIMSAQKKKPD